MVADPGPGAPVPLSSAHPGCQLDPEVVDCVRCLGHLLPFGDVLHQHCGNPHRVRRGGLQERSPPFSGPYRLPLTRISIPLSSLLFFRGGSAPWSIPVPRGRPCICRQFVLCGGAGPARAGVFLSGRRPLRSVTAFLGRAVFDCPAMPDLARRARASAGAVFDCPAAPDFSHGGSPPGAGRRVWSAVVGLCQMADPRLGGAFFFTLRRDWSRHGAPPLRRGRPVHEGPGVFLRGRPPPRLGGRSWEAALRAHTGGDPRLGGVFLEVRVWGDLACG